MGTDDDSFPAAATTTTFLLRAYDTAERSGGSSPTPPKEQLMICAPWSAAQVMPLAMTASVPSPLLPSTFTGKIEAVQATPAMPLPLFVLAAATLATCVPWPPSSTVLALPSAAL